MELYYYYYYYHKKEIACSDLGSTLPTENGNEWWAFVDTAVKLNVQGISEQD
jgi:hypothetical protein